MAFTSTASNTLLNSFTGKSNSGAILQNCYMGLSTTTPNADGTNFTEPSSSNGYARATIGLYGQGATQVMGTPSEGTIENASIIYFPEATASWGTITYFGLFNAATGGSLMIYGPLDTSVTVAANYVPLFRTGNFSLTLE